MPNAVRAQLPRPNPRRILTLKQWCELNSISEDYARKLIATGQGPKVTQLGEHRIGVREDHNAEWQDARIRGAK